MKKIYAIILFLFLVNSTFSQELGYVEGEVIVKFHSKYVDKAAVDDELLNEGTLAKFLTIDGLEKLQNKLPNYPNIENWRCKKIFTKLKTTDTISITRQGRIIKMPIFWTTFVIEIDLELVKNELKFINYLDNIGSPLVYAHPNYTALENLSVPDDPEYVNQHALNPTLYPNATVNIEDAWSLETGKRHIKVGVYDTGIDTTHPDLEVLTGIGLNTEVNDWGTPSSGHGTLVAGIIGAKRNNGIGIAGVAGGDGSDTSGVSLLDFNRRGNSPQPTISIIARGIVDGARKVGEYRDWEDFYQQDHSTGNFGGFGIHIGNHSYRMRTKVLIKKDENDKVEKEIPEDIVFDPDESAYNPVKCALCKEAMLFSYQNGVVNVVAAGNTKNNEESPHHHPNDYPQSSPANMIIKVGASSRFGDLLHQGNNAPDEGTYSSQWGMGMDLIAPGTKDLAYSTGPLNFNADTIYHRFNGTSAAAPYVSGAAALLLSYYNKPCYSERNLSPDDVEHILTRSSSQISNIIPSDSTGWGRLNVYEALKMIELPQNQVIHLDSIVSSVEIERDTIKVNFFNAITEGLNPWASAGTTEEDGPIGNTFPENFEKDKEYLVERVKIEQTLDFSEYMQSSTEIIDYWVNRSSCNSLKYFNDIDSAFNSTGGYNYFSDTFDVNPTATIESINGNQVTISGYYYNLIEGYLLGQFDNQTLPINFWYPAHPSDAFMPVSILIRDTVNTIEYDFPCTDIRPLTDTTLNSLHSNFQYGVKVYPNPSENEFIIEFYSGDKGTELEVFDQFGRKVFSKNIIQKNQYLRDRINLGKFARGVYFINISSGESTVSKKILKL